MHRTRGAPGLRAPRRQVWVQRQAVPLLRGALTSDFIKGHETMHLRFGHF